MNMETEIFIKDNLECKRVHLFLVFMYLKVDPF